MSKWIRCRDRLPRKGGEYLVYCELSDTGRKYLELTGNAFEERPFIHTFFAGPEPMWKPKFLSDGASVPRYDITHWRRIPRPPFLKVGSR